MRIHPDALADADVRALIAAHVAEMHTTTPPESVHALDLGGLQAPGVRVWAAREDDGALLGVVALADLGGGHGELKSMRTTPGRTRRGTGAALLRHLLAVAVAEGMDRVSLETGAGDFFAPARRLYERHGFVQCPPFAAYGPDPLSVFLTLPLGDRTNGDGVRGRVVPE